MSLEEWIDLTIIKALTKHASSTIVALALFSIVRFVLTRIPLSQTMRSILEGADEFVLLGLFFWLIIQMGFLLWKGRIKNGSASFVMVV